MSTHIYIPSSGIAPLCLIKLHNFLPLTDR
nr:MAG TPA: hypothetical protein [Caudoviricetes sp.]